jgi:hypothetical protein
MVKSPRHPGTEPQTESQAEATTAQSEAQPEVTTAQLTDWITSSGLTEAEIQEVVSKIRRARALPDVRKRINEAIIAITRDREHFKGILVRLIAGDDQTLGRAYFQRDQGTIEIEILAGGIRLKATRPNQEPRCEDITRELADKDLEQTKQYLMQRIEELISKDKLDASAQG